MILSIYAYRDKKLGRYQTPMINGIEKDTAAVTLSRAVLGLEKEKRQALRDLELYYLGSFDDKTGSIVLSEREFICSLDSLIAESEVTHNESREETISS